MRHCRLLTMYHRYMDRHDDDLFPTHSNFPQLFLIFIIDFIEKIINLLNNSHCDSGMVDMVIVGSHV